MVKLEEFDKNKLEEYKQRILKTEKFVEGKKIPKYQHIDFTYGMRMWLNGLLGWRLLIYKDELIVAKTWEKFVEKIEKAKI